MHSVFHVLTDNEINPFTILRLLFFKLTTISLNTTVTNQVLNPGHV